MSELADAAAALGRALAAKPAGDPQAFSQALQAVCRRRDALRRALRAGDAAAAPPLAEMNGAVTLLMSGRYPLEAAPWPALEALHARLEVLAAAPA